MKRLLLSFSIVFILSGVISAQDLHFSQFFNSPLNTNPGLTGVFNGDLRLGLHYKQQWRSVPVDYMTFSGYADKKFYSEKNEKGFFSGGILFNFDRAGDSRLQVVQGAISGTYTFILNEKNLITVGPQLGVTNLSADYGQSSLSWGNQFIGTMYVPTAPNGETFTSKQAVTYFDLGAGFNYRWQKSSRTKVDVGAGFYNLSSPDQAYNDQLSELPLKWTANLSASIQVSDLVDVWFHGLAQVQDVAHEYVPSIGGRLYINQKRGSQFALEIGGIGRLNNNEVDSWTPYVGFEFNEFFLGLNYDLNSSRFDVATDGKGGPEISFRYLVKNVQPLENFKNCPIF